jgi:hypothetical protein
MLLKADCRCKCPCIEEKATMTGEEMQPKEESMTSTQESQDKKVK